MVTVCICVTWGRLISILKSPYAELRCRAMSYLYSTWMRTICRTQILLNVLFLRSDILTAKLRVRVNSKIVRFGRVFRIKKNKFALNNCEYVLNVSFSDHSFFTYWFICLHFQQWEKRRYKLKKNQIRTSLWNFIIFLCRFVIWY